MFYKKIGLITISALFITIILFVSDTAIFAQGEDPENSDQTDENSDEKAEEEKKKRSEELQNEIEELGQKLTDARSKKTSLTNQIVYMDTQIAIAQLEVQRSTVRIAEMKIEIEKLTGKISTLEGSLDNISEIFIDRVKATYKTGQVPAMLLFANANGSTELIARTAYLKRIQAHDKKLMYEVQSTKTDFEDQKTLLEDKREELAVLKIKLEAQSVELDQQKVDKERLLVITKNDEQQYQELLVEAQRELSQIQRAVSVVIRTGEAVSVDRGEIIGTMGNSGYSTGAHLHFSIYRYSVEDFKTLGGWDWYYNSYINPLEKLSSKSVIWDTDCGHDSQGSSDAGSGNWEWPMSNPRITQNYGSNTCYNWMYKGKVHPALDMVDSNDASIRSTEKGEAYYCRNCLEDGGNGVFVFHEDNYMSVYWHLQ